MVWKYLALRIAAGLDFSLLNLAIFLVAFFSGISTQWLAFAEENNSHQTNGEIPFLYSSPFAFRNETPSPAPNVSYGTPHNRPHARTHHVAVPAARGQITDRHGNALAINSAVIYPVFDSYSRVDHPGSRWMNQDHSEMLSWMIEELDYLSEFQAESRESLIRIWLQDYRDFEKDHPYLPYFFSLPFNQEQIEILQQKQAIIPRGFRSIPSYFRLYPSGHAFSHVLGYVDRIRANSAHRKKGMIQLFPRYTGKSFGLDSFFENHLRGTDGSWWRFFNNAKVKLRDEIKKAPQTNHHVVSTLDKELQEAIHSKFIQKNIDGAVYVLSLIHI